MLITLGGRGVVGCGPQYLEVPSLSLPCHDHVVTKFLFATGNSQTVDKKAFELHQIPQMELAIYIINKK
jgi:hypothetical protein